MSDELSRKRLTKSVWHKEAELWRPLFAKFVALLCKTRVKKRAGSLVPGQVASWFTSLQFPCLKRSTDRVELHRTSLR